MARIPAALALAAGGAAAAILVSGGSSADPRTPPALPGLPAPFLGTAVAGAGGLTAAIDAYGSVVDLRATGPAGEALIANPAARQAAGTVSPDTGIVLRVGVGGATPAPVWRADRVRQDYLAGTNVVRTRAGFGPASLTVLDAVDPASPTLARRIRVEARGGEPIVLTASLNLRGDRERRCRGGGELPDLRRWASRGTLTAALVCSFGGRPAAGDTVERAAAADRRWLARALPLGAAAPDWARRMQARSLLVLRALTDAGSGAVAAGARDGWAYVWPRDAGATAIALAAAGYRVEARRIARFLAGLDPRAAARFDGEGAPVAGRPAQGDAAGWIAAAAGAAGLPAQGTRSAWRGLADYGERSGDSGDYLANSIAAGAPAARITAEFGRGRLLVRGADNPSSGAESAAAWAVRPFPRPALFAQARATIASLAADVGRFGIQPAADWPGEEPWSAPTAWSAWSLAALGDRGVALRLIGALRRVATAAGALPERADERSGIARSTTPLVWSHAFASLALRELWPAE
jgi:hypothetical protein